MNRHDRRKLAADPETPDKAKEWMKTQLMVAVRDLEAKFAGANVTVIVSMPPGEEPLKSFAPRPPLFSHATSAEPQNLRDVLHALQVEMAKGAQ